MFVVQRAFALVRRAYDPDEVDRHLELVSQWFTSTDIGRTFARQRAELEQRERAVASVWLTRARSGGSIAVSDVARASHRTPATAGRART